VNKPDEKAKAQQLKEAIEAFRVVLGGDPHNWKGRAVAAIYEHKDREVARFLAERVGLK
jgi:hypothetical protein